MLIRIYTMFRNKGEGIAADMYFEFAYIQSVQTRYSVSGIHFPLDALLKINL